MCLGVPGKVVSKEPNALGMMMGVVSFGGVKKEVCLAYVPEVEVGDYVIVHAGFAIQFGSDYGVGPCAHRVVLLRQQGSVALIQENGHAALSDAVQHEARGGAKDPARVGALLIGVNIQC